MKTSIVIERINAALRDASVGMFLTVSKLATVNLPEGEPPFSTSAITTRLHAIELGMAQRPDWWKPGTFMTRDPQGGHIGTLGVLKIQPAPAEDPPPNVK